MAKTINFWEISVDDETFVVDQRQLGFMTDQATARSGIVYAEVTDDDIKAKYGDNAIKRTVTLKPNSYRLRLDVQRLKAVSDADKGVKEDQSLDGVARVAACVDAWDLKTYEGKDATIDVEGVLDLPGNMPAYLDERVCEYLMADIVRDKSFLEMFVAKSNSSDEKTQAA